MAFGIDFSTVGKAIGNAMESIGTYSAKAAAQANTISQRSQSAQGAFNQSSADQANMLNQNAMSSQWAFNSAQANAANLNEMNMWQTAADWNEKMWEKQAAFNAEQAEIQRSWQHAMDNTKYQRAVEDMSKAGLNPILAATNGGIGAGVPTGAVASVGGAQMSSAQAQMASGGLLGANTAHENNFMGQMEQMSSTLALLGAIFSGISSAADAAGGLGSVGEDVMEGVGKMLYGEETGQKFAKVGSATFKKWFENVGEKGLTNGTIETAKDAYNAYKHAKKGQITNKQDEAQYLRYNAWNKSTYKYTKPKG